MGKFYSFYFPHPYPFNFVCSLDKQKQMYNIFKSRCTREYVTIFLFTIFILCFLGVTWKFFVFTWGKKHLFYLSIYSICRQNHYLVEHFIWIVKFRSTVLWTYFNQFSPHYYQSKNAIRRFGDSCFLQSLNQQCHFEFILLRHVTTKKMLSLVLYKSPLLDHFSVCCNSE